MLVLNNFLKKYQFLKNFYASIAVFFVSLPLAIGIAVASGAPAAHGILVGIIGGLVVASIGGTPWLVNGCPAGLVVVMYEIINTYGLDQIGAIIFLAGVIQIILAKIKFVQWLNHLDQNVIYGMLAGIGAIIILQQILALFEIKNKANFFHNLLQIRFVYDLLVKFDDLLITSVLIALTCILSLILWDRYFKARTAIPGPIIAIIFASCIANLFFNNLKFIEIPTNLFSVINFTNYQLLKDAIINYQIIIASLTVALIASSQGLVVANAVDQIQKTKSDLTKHLYAFGIGNMLCGICGLIALTGVPVQSITNIRSGASNKLSPILLGVWLLIFGVFFSNLINYIPVAALSSLLIYMGTKIFNYQYFKIVLHSGSYNLFIYLITFFGVLLFNVLTGVFLGLLFCLLKMFLIQKEVFYKK